CGKHQALAPALDAPPIAFRLLPLVPTESLPDLSNQARGSCLPLRHQSKPVGDDDASTSAGSSKPAAQKCDIAKSSASCPAGIHECREKHAGKLPALRQQRRQSRKGFRKPSCTPRRDSR